MGKLPDVRVLTFLLGGSSEWTIRRNVSADMEDMMFHIFDNDGTARVTVPRVGAAMGEDERPLMYITTFACVAIHIARFPFGREMVGLHLSAKTTFLRSRS